MNMRSNTVTSADLGAPGKIVRPTDQRLNKPVDLRIWMVGFAAVIGILVLISRVLSSGPVYFADGPAHIAAINNHTYVIQPPGYWLFTRLGGFFSDSAAGIQAMNWVFSALGCIAFYGCARRLASSPVAELGTVLYSTVFFAWFSGTVHSTYASQLLFPPLTFYCMLRYREDMRVRWLVGVAASFSIGAGLRLSDGVFQAPMLLLFAWSLPNRHRIPLLALALAMCLLWLIPNEVALHNYGQVNTAGQLRRVATGAVVFGKLNIYTLSNAVRFFLPLLLALGPTAYFMFRSRDRISLALWTWVAPGTAFFLLVYISDATYLNFLLAGYLLLCLRGMGNSARPRTPIIALAIAIVVNLGLYLGFRPLETEHTSVLLLEKDLGNYTMYASTHQWWMKKLPGHAQETENGVEPADAR